MWPALVCIALACAAPLALASSALPTLIAAAPIEVAELDVLSRRRRAALGLSDLGLRNTIAAMNSAELEDDVWPPPNTLLRKQTELSRRRVTLRDNDTVIVSFPKVGRWVLIVRMHVLRLLRVAVGVGAARPYFASIASSPHMIPS